MNDTLLDRFMPEFDVADRHGISVNAPAAVTLATAADMNLMQSPLIRAIFRARELILRSRPRPPNRLEDCWLGQSGSGGDCSPRRPSARS